MLTVDQVKAIVTSERDYQKRRWGVRSPGTGEMVLLPKPMAAYLVYIQHFLTRAVTAITTQPGVEAAMAEIRKVAALAGAAVSLGGVPAYNGEPEPVEHYLLYLRGLACQALDNRGAMLTEEDFDVILEEIWITACRCLYVHGAPLRDEPEVINARDGLPA